MSITTQTLTNHAQTTVVANGLNNSFSPSTFSVATNTGSRLPVPRPVYYVVVWSSSYTNPSDDPNYRVGAVTVRSGDVLTAVWGLFGTGLNPISGTPNIAYLSTDDPILDDNTSVSRNGLSLVTVGPSNADYVCDGVADEVQIQNAITTMSAQGGGIVVLKGGDYTVSSPIVPKSNVILRGEGESTILRKSSTGQIIQDDGTSFNDFTVESITFYGKVNQTVSVPTTGRTTSGAGTTSAIKINGSLDPNTVGAPLITNVTIRNCIFRNIASLPITIFGVTGKAMVTGCEFTNCKDAGWGFDEEVICIGNHSYMSSDNGFSISRGCRKITCIGNTVELCAFSGIWLSGFFGDLGPTEFTCVGNSIRNVGENGIVLRDAPKYGVVSGNFIYQGYNRGPVGAPNDKDCCGIFVSGYPYGTPSGPSSYATYLNITGNTIFAACKAGIYYNGSKQVTITNNLIGDIGTQFLADGSTTIASSDVNQNVGIFLDVGTTVDNIFIKNNAIYDQRGTPYCNWAIQPITNNGVIQFGNTWSGMRNSINKLVIVDDAASGSAPSMSVSGPDSNIDINASPKGSGRFTVKSSSGATLSSNLNLHNAGTGAGAGSGQVFSAGTVGSFLGGLAAVRLDSSTRSRLVFRILSNSALPAADNTSPFYIEGTAGSPFIGLNAGIAFKRTPVADANYTALVSDFLIAYTSLTAGRTVTLPTAAIAGQVLYIVDEAGSAAANNITAAGAGGQLINGVPSVAINTNNGVLRLYFDGANWHTI